MMTRTVSWISFKWDQSTEPFVPAKAGTQGNGTNSQSKWPLGSRLRGNERERGSIRTRHARGFWSFVAVAAALAVLMQPVSAQEKLRVGKAVAESFAFIPLDVGLRQGIFKRHGLDIEITAFGGGARLQQAMAADGIDIGVSAGPELALLEKGAPVKGVAMPFGPPVYLMLLVRPGDAIRSAADLKGRKIGVSSARSLTGWLAIELSRQQGFGPRGIELVGSPPRTSLASIKTGQIDGMVTDLTFALRAEQAGEGKILLGFGDLVRDFHTHIIYAADKLIAGRPDAVRRFNAGWFDTIAFMRANKAETVRIAMAVLELPEAIASPTYDKVMPVFSTDGKFDDKALATLGRSFVDLKLLPSEPKDLRRHLTEEFLPKR
jgi:NitT/TauT family transport system substrate-binding protein